MSKRLGFFKERYRQQFPYTPAPAGTAIVTPSLSNSNTTVVFHIDGTNISANTVLDYSLSNVTNSNFVSGSALVAGTVTLDSQGNANLSFTYDEGYDANNTANVNFFMNVQSQGGKNLANSNVVTAFQPVTFDAYADGFSENNFARDGYNNPPRDIYPSGYKANGVPNLDPAEPMNYTEQVIRSSANTYTFTGGVDNLSAVYKVIKYNLNENAFAPNRTNSIRISNSILSGGNISPGDAITNSNGNTLIVYNVAHDGTDPNVSIVTAGFNSWPGGNIGNTAFSVGDTVSCSSGTGTVTSVEQGWVGVQEFVRSNANLTVSNLNADPDNTELEALIVGPGGGGGLGAAAYVNNPPVNHFGYNGSAGGGGGGGGYKTANISFTEFDISSNTTVSIGKGGYASVSPNGTREPTPEPITVDQYGTGLFINGSAYSNVSIVSITGNVAAGTSGDIIKVEGGQILGNVNTIAIYNLVNNSDYDWSNYNAIDLGHTVTNLQLISSWNESAGGYELSQQLAGSNVLLSPPANAVVNYDSSLKYKAGRGGGGTSILGQNQGGSGDYTQVHQAQSGNYRGSGGGSAALSTQVSGTNSERLYEIGTGGNISGNSGAFGFYQQTTLSGFDVTVTAGGGGGGAGGSGSNASISISGAGFKGANILAGGSGGDGITNSITGENIVYAAGGGGGGAVAGAGGSSNTGGIGGSNVNILTYPVLSSPPITPFGSAGPVTNTAGAPGTGSGGGGAGALANVALLTSDYNTSFGGRLFAVGGHQPPFNPNSPNPELDMNYPGAGASGTVIFRWKYRYKKLSL